MLSLETLLNRTRPLAPSPFRVASHVKGSRGARLLLLHRHSCAGTQRRGSSCSLHAPRAVFCWLTAAASCADSESSCSECAHSLKSGCGPRFFCRLRRAAPRWAGVCSRSPVLRRIAMSYRGDSPRRGRSRSPPRYRSRSRSPRRGGGGYGGGGGRYGGPDAGKVSLLVRNLSRDTR